MTELETMQRAKMYIDSLAKGIDPTTGEIINDDSVLNNVRISRCLFYVSDVLSKVIDNGGEVGKKVYEPMIPFNISQEQIQNIYISQEPIGVSEIAKRIASVLDDNVKSVPATHITAWLCESGYLKEETVNNKKRKVATLMGESLGIVTLDAISMKGVPYKKNVYSPQAQQFIVSNLKKIDEFNHR